MGEIVGAGLLAHVPTIVLPADVRRALNHGRESTLHTGLHDLRREVFDRLRPDLVVVFDSHWFTTVEFVVTAHHRRLGEIAAATPDCWITPIDNEHLPITYATTNFLPFLQGTEAWVSVSTCQTAEPADFAAAGRVIAQAVADSPLRVVLIASGALSHTFHTLRTLRDHEAADEEHIHSSAAREADHAIIESLERGDHASVMNHLGEFLGYKPEARFAHYQMMVAALGGARCVAPGRLFSAYENSIGTGQVHLWFDRPTDGWTGEGW